MHFDFLPSRTLTGYLAKMFFARILAVLVMLVLVLMMMDLLSESGAIPRGPRAMGRRNCSPTPRCGSRS